MQFSLAASAALFSLALSLSTAQASPFDSDLLSRGTTPATSPLCNNFKAACQKQCGTQSTKTTCIDNGTGKLPQLKCRCGKGLLADKTAEVLLRIALTCAAKPVDSPTTGGGTGSGTGSPGTGTGSPGTGSGSPGSPGTGTGSPGSPGTGTQTPVITYGPNLFLNPGLEQPGLSSWDPWHCESSPGGRTNKDGDTAKARCTSTYVNTFGIDVDAALTQYVRGLETGKSYTYTLSCWARLSPTSAPTPSNLPPPTVGLGQYDVPIQRVPLTTEWALYTQDFDDFPAAQHFYFQTSIDGASVEFDDLSLARKIVS